MPAQFALPPDTRAVGTGNPPADMNAMIDTVTALGAGYSVLNAAYAGGADPTGVADSTAAFQAAIAALPAAGGVITIPPGTYKITGSGTALQFGRNQGMRGTGRGTVKLAYTGTGTCVSAFDSSFSSSVSFGGTFAGFTIDGTGAGASAVGMSWGNLAMARCSDIEIKNFTGASAIGLQFKNGADNTTWSEEGEWTGINTGNCTVGVMYDTGSFDYSLFQFVITANSGQDGIRFQNDGSLAGCRLELRGNFKTGAGNTASVFNFDPGNASGTSRINGCEVFVNVECDGSSGTGHVTISMAGNASSQFQGHGVLVFNDESTQFQAAAINAPVQFGFSGRVSGAGLGYMDAGDGLAVQGGSQYNLTGSLTTALPGTVFLKNGNVFAYQLASGNNTLALSGHLERARIIDLYLAQPAGGGAGTLTWPVGTLFPAGGPPVLSAVNSTVDHIRMTYLAGPAVWFAELAGLRLDSTAALAEVDDAVQAETQVAAYTIPANLPAGSTYRFRAWITAAIGGTAGTITTRARLGGIGGAIIGALNVTPTLTLGGTGTFVIEGEITLQIPGSSGTYAGYHEIRGVVSATALSGMQAGTVTKNSTTGQSLFLSVGLSSATSSVACLGAIFERTA